MRKSLPPHPSLEPGLRIRRRWLPWILSTALVVLTTLSITRFIGLQSELRTQVVAQLDGQLQDQIAVWERNLIKQLDDVMRSIGEEPAHTAFSEVQLREREQWFDAIYLWQPRTRILSGGKIIERPGEFLFPPPPLSEPPAGISPVVCLQSEENLDGEGSARRIIEQCRSYPLPFRMHAASEAAVKLARLGKFDEAIHALDSSGLDPDTHLQRALRQRGVDPSRLAMQRFQRADYQIRAGHVFEGIDTYFRTCVQISALDATEFGQTLLYIRSEVLQKLRQHGRDDLARQVEADMAKAERRILAYNEIKERILQRPARPSSAAAQFIFDQYTRVPFLLYYGPVRQGELGAALQLDQPTLIANFLSSVERYRADIVITDVGGNVVVGPKQGGPMQVQASFSRTLSHLRVGMREAAIESRMERLDDQWIVPIVVIALCVILSVFAIVSQLRADRRQEQLLARQRHFTARVTHELKTPLAGIRVMAENLESGAFPSAAQQRGMARSILLEADRLTARVDEILSVASERKLPTPEPFDPEEVALEAIDLWGPRLELAGVGFHADLHPTDLVLGDADAVRDLLGCLLDNAIKYHRDDHPDPQVWFTLAQDGAMVTFEVADNGIGVPQDMRDAIFERFVRVEGPNRGRSGGHGLGLAQVKEVALAHGGDVRCSDGLEGGARFHVKLAAIRG